MKRPILSIITINFNNRIGLEKTLESVFNQSNTSFEYIIVDGGSSDGSKELLENNSAKISKYVSEPDGGIYNAMNKGAKMASGKYITYLNSGDILHDNDVVKDVLSDLSSNDSDDILFGKIVNVFGNKEFECSFNHELSLISLHYDVVNHSGSFIKRELQLKYPYREDLKICSDRQFFIEAIVFDNCSYGHIDRLISKFDKTGVSGPQSSEIMMKENDIILKSLLPPRIFSDYKATNLQLHQFTRELAGYNGFVKWLIKINKPVVNAYKWLNQIRKR